MVSGSRSKIEIVAHALYGRPWILRRFIPK